MILAELLHGHGLTVLRGLQALQILGKLAHQIAARNPHRQRQQLLRRRPGDMQLHIEKMGVHRAGLHGEADVGANAGCVENRGHGSSRNAGRSMRT
ncbi:hypothetical protein SDC9_108670 [bioreactor metagenome]|uniref:Uncharacterized protein n=1 Tax=bioreactor metagenome TaxID=1076179 RepID=A0A645B8S8_9ZZZZ